MHGSRALIWIKGGACFPYVCRQRGEAAAIRTIFQQRGELSAAIELRRLFPASLTTAGAGMRAHDRWLAAGAGSAAARDSFKGDPDEIATVAARQKRHVVNLLLVLMVFAIWFLMNHHSLFTLPP